MLGIGGVGLVTLYGNKDFHSGIIILLKLAIEIGIYSNKISIEKSTIDPFKDYLRKLMREYYQ